MKTVGDVLKEARESLHLSQEAVAVQIKKLTGETFSRAALAQIESGSTKNPKPQNLQAACDVLGIDFRSALRGILLKTESSEDVDRDNTQTVIDADLLKLTASLTQEQLEQLKAFGQFLIASTATPQSKTARQPLPKTIELPPMKSLPKSFGKSETEHQPKRRKPKKNG